MMSASLLRAGRGFITRKTGMSGERADRWGGCVWGVRNAEFNLSLEIVCGMSGEERPVGKLNKLAIEIH